MRWVTARIAERGPRAPTMLSRRILRMALLRFAALVALLGLGVAGQLTSAVNGAYIVSVRAEESADEDLQVAMLQQQADVASQLASADAGRPIAFGQSRARTAAALVRLRQQAAGQPWAGQQARVEAATRAWEGWADAVRAPGAAIALPTTIEQGQRLFAVFSAEHGRLTSLLEADYMAAVGRTVIAVWSTTIVLTLGSVVVGVILVQLARAVRRLGLDPIRHLAVAATRVAGGQPASIPHTDRSDEIGALARALRGWQDASVEQQILAEQAPAGIARADLDGRLVHVNRRLSAMLGYPKDELVGRPLGDLLHPGEGRAPPGHQAQLWRDGDEPVVAEWRALRKDGTTLWCSVRLAPVRTPAGQLDGVIAILENITDRKRELERAAEVQRELLPQETPAIEGYDLAGTCLPALEVAGDFYDWVSPDRGHLDLTVADVMGKGLGAALVMATVRAALRTAPYYLGPAARVQLTSSALALGLSDEGMFVTLFHARLDVASGTLHYVDAGHGHCGIVRASGELVPLPERSLPLGVLPGQVFDEGVARLEPGDTLVVYSDGLVETEERTIGLRELAPLVEGPADAAAVVRRLAGTMPRQLCDDVTIVVLRRQAVSTTPVPLDGVGPARAGQAPA
jgi:PAS domain S-box-containing protein